MTAEELLMMSDDVETYIADDALVIDPESRTILTPVNGLILGVESDKEAERVQFVCPRFVGDNIDLSELQIRTIYQNANGEKDFRISTDVSVDGDNIRFSWLLSRKVTKYKGKVKFIVCAIRTQADGTTKNEWNTTLAEGISLEGLEVDILEEEFEEPKDIVLQLLGMLDEKATEIMKEIDKYLEKLKIDNNLDVNSENAIQNKVVAKQFNQLSEEIVEINEALVNGFDITNCEFREAIELENVIDGYVNSGGYSVTSGDTGGYAVNEKPITLLKGETIYIFAKCITNVALIATYKSTWYGMTPLLLGNGGDKQIYEYTPQENIDVVISYHKNSGCEVYRKIVGSDVIESVKDTKELKESVDFAKIFHKAGGIGDSLMSGEIARWTENGDEYIDRYNFSWLSNIARDIGAECVHYSQGGMTAKAWVNDSGGFKSRLLAETNKCSAYFIGLCMNDWNQSYPLGTINDNAGTDSFVGYYKGIIETVKTHNPNAVIFLVSAYINSEKGILYSNMISEIAELYSNCYYIDFVNNSDIYTNDSVYANYSHFTTLGYVKVADTIHKLVNNVIKENANTNFFKFFALNNE